MVLFEPVIVDNIKSLNFWDGLLVATSEMYLLCFFQDDGEDD